MKLVSVRDGVGITGVIRLTNFLIDTPRAAAIDRELAVMDGSDPERYGALMAELASLCRRRTVEFSNLVVLAGRVVLAKRLAGDVTVSGAVNYGALGTDDTAVNTNDVALGTEVKRKLFARRVRTAAAVKFDFFYSKLDTDGTFEEFGMFVDGTAAADSGELFNRALTGGWTKTNNEAMTVECTVNINDNT